MAASPLRPSPDVREGGTRTMLTRSLVLVPTLGFLVGTPLANTVEPYVLGLPFSLFWQALWIVSSGAVMAVVYALDSGSRTGTDQVGE